MRTVNSARNPKWADPTGYRIDLEVDFDELDEVYVPFTAVKNTAETPDHEYSHDLFVRAVAGEFGEVAEFSGFPDITGDVAVNELRRQRNALLAETDYIENPSVWSNLSAEKQTEWTNYRQSLRDITSSVDSVTQSATVDVIGPNYTVDYSFNVEWPAKPA